MNIKFALVSLMAMTAATAALAQGADAPATDRPHHQRPHHDRGHPDRPHGPGPFVPVADFATADADGNGLLSAEELAAHMLAGMEKPVAERAARMVEFLDRDGDGLLTEEELVPERPDPFAAMDTDGDGQISREEFDAMAERRGPRGPRPAAE